MYFRTPKISRTNYGYGENSLIFPFALAYNFYVNWLFFCSTIFFSGQKKKYWLLLRSFICELVSSDLSFSKFMQYQCNVVFMQCRVYRCIKIPSNLVRLVCRVCRCIEIPKYLVRLLCRVYRCIRIQILKKKVGMPSGFMRKIPQLPLVTKKGLQSF